MQPDAKHQQHDAYPGQLGGDMHVGHKSGRRRPDDDACNEVADQRRSAMKPRIKATPKPAAMVVIREML
jgi:hypothetical protein